MLIVDRDPEFTIAALLHELAHRIATGLSVGSAHHKNTDAPAEKGRWRAVPGSHAAGLGQWPQGRLGRVAAHAALRRLLRRQQGGLDAGRRPDPVLHCLGPASPPTLVSSRAAGGRGACTTRMKALEQEVWAAGAALRGTAGARGGAGPGPGRPFRPGHRPGSGGKKVVKQLPNSKTVRGRTPYLMRWQGHASADESLEQDLEEHLTNFPERVEDSEYEAAVSGRLGCAI